MAECVLLFRPTLAVIEVYRRNLSMKIARKIMLVRPCRSEAQDAADRHDNDHLGPVSTEIRYAFLWITPV
jgi:hypothetical protein